MANSNSEKPASDRGHESYADDAKAIRVLSVDSSGTVAEVILVCHPDVRANVQTDWTITRQDGQPDDESVTFTSGDIYKRTFTYGTVGVENGMLISRTWWVLQ